MKNPFEVLEIPETATDADIKKAYLRKVREYPPERAPQRFQEIRTAFETVRTWRDRLRYQLFHSEPPDVQALLTLWLQGSNAQRPSKALFQQTLAWTLKLGQTS